MTRTETIAAAIANARGARRGLPHIRNILDALPSTLLAEVMDDAEAAQQASAEWERQTRGQSNRATFRDPEEVQAAHDRLTAVLLGEVPVELVGEARVATHAACDALCWALLHDHNDAFAKNLKAIDDELAAKGFQLRRIDG